MDDISIGIEKFITKQPKVIKEKYIAFLKLKANNTAESENQLYSTDFSFDDLRLLTYGITSIILDQINVDKLVSNISAK